MEFNKRHDRTYNNTITKIDFIFKTCCECTKSVHSNAQDNFMPISVELNIIEISHANRLQTRASFDI